MNNEFRFVDLSVALGPGPGNAVPVEVERMSHFAGGKHLSELVGISTDCLCGGLGWASERVSAITHSGTHVDAPFHYAPRSNGTATRTIDEMPLDWFWGPGKCFSVDEKPSDILISTDEFIDIEARTSTTVSPGDIVLFRTGAARYWNTDDYNVHGRGVAPELVQLLIERGVRVFGTDAWSIDPPYWVMRKQLERGGANTVWGAHFVGRRHEFCVIEKLTNLNALPLDGFFVASFPIKVLRGSAGWARVVALIPRGQSEAHE